MTWPGPGQVHGVQWSHEFDLVACGFVSSLVSAGSLFFTFVSWPLFCSSVKHSHPCFPPRNESKVYRGVILRGFIYLFFRRFALGYPYIYTRSYWIFSFISRWIPVIIISYSLLDTIRVLFSSSESFCVRLLGSGVGGLSV